MVKKVQSTKLPTSAQIIRGQAQEIQNLRDMLHNRDAVKAEYVSPVLTGAAGCAQSATEARSIPSLGNVISPINISPISKASGAYEGTIPKLGSELSHLQDYLHNRLDELVKKLEPALGPTPPATASPGEKGSRMGCCAVGDMLISRIEVQMQLNRRVNELIERIAL